MQFQSRPSVQVLFFLLSQLRRDQSHAGHRRAGEKSRWPFTPDARDHLWIETRVTISSPSLITFFLLNSILRSCDNTLNHLFDNWATPSTGGATQKCGWKLRTHGSYWTLLWEFFAKMSYIFFGKVTVRDLGFLCGNCKKGNENYISYTSPSHSFCQAALFNTGICLQPLTGWTHSISISMSYKHLIQSVILV